MDTLANLVMLPCGLVAPIIDRNVLVTEYHVIWMCVAWDPPRVGFATNVTIVLDCETGHCGYVSIVLERVNSVFMKIFS